MRRAKSANLQSAFNFAQKVFISERLSRKGAKTQSAAAFSKGFLCALAPLCEISFLRRGTPCDLRTSCAKPSSFKENGKLFTKNSVIVSIIETPIRLIVEKCNHKGDDHGIN